MDIATLLPWSDPKEVNTKAGPRLLCKAEPTPAFWDAWKSSKDELKAAGVSCSKNLQGDWEACWWQPIPEEVKAERAQAVAESRATSADIDLPRPDGLDYMPFQKAGIRYALARPNVLIGDEMGLGKTIQAIGIINSDPAIDSALIICPKSLKLNWKRELEKWLTRPLSIGMANGKGWPETQIVIVNYEATGKHREQLLARTWGALILDEAHLIKNAKTQRSENIKGRREDKKKGKEAIAPIPAVRHIRLTGTPIVNRPIELYNIISDLHPTWASFWSFAKRYCGGGSNGWGYDFSGATNLDELQRKLRETIMVRRLKSEVLTELPAKIRQIVEIEVDSADMRSAVSAEQAYEEMSEDRLADLRAAVELSKAESDDAYKAAVNRLREAEQVDFTEMSRLRHMTALAKVPAVIAQVENDLQDGDNKVIIAAHHRDVIEELQAGLDAFRPVALTGGQAEQGRDAAVHTFQNDPTCRVFIGSIMAAGVGITLTAAHMVIFAELDWVPGNVTQMEDRAHRIGQTETVLIKHIVLSGSLDARMAQTLVNKQTIIDSALDKNHPERTAPVYEPKVKAATAEAKPDLLALIAERITPEQISLIHAGLRFLAGYDLDGARELNDVGYNKLDSQIGRSLAERPTLTPKQAALGAKLLRKYHRQLGDEINQVIKTVTTVESEKS